MASVDIRNLQSSGETIVYPVTHEKAVIDNSGITLETKLISAVYFGDDEGDIEDLDSSYLRRLSSLEDNYVGYNAQGKKTGESDSAYEARKTQARTNIGAASEEQTAFIEYSTISLHECATAANDNVKIIPIDDDVLQSAHREGAEFKVMFRNGNTSDNARFQLGTHSETIDELYWNGERATSTNHWLAGEEAVVIYKLIPGTNDYAYFARPMVNGIDEEPVRDSKNLVYSGGMFFEDRKINARMFVEVPAWESGSYDQNNPTEKIETNNYICLRDICVGNGTEVTLKLETSSSSSVRYQVELASWDGKSAGMLDNYGPYESQQLVQPFTPLGNIVFVRLSKTGGSGLMPIDPSEGVNLTMSFGSIVERLNDLEARIVELEERLKPVVPMKGNVRYYSSSSTTDFAAYGEPQRGDYGIVAGIQVLFMYDGTAWIEDPATMASDRDAYKLDNSAYDGGLNGHGFMWNGSSWVDVGKVEHAHA